MSSHFVKHTPCPKCRSRDNLAVYSDGHEFCFGCGYFKPSLKSLEALKEKLQNEGDTTNVGLSLSLPVGVSSDLPLHVQAWLKKYGITDSEIKHYRLCYNPKTESLVFPIWSGDRSDILVFWQERYFGKKFGVPKYITYGGKDFELGIISNKYTKDRLVLVEDFISAIKVARFCTAAPLLGSSISARTLKWTCERFKCLRIWLDMDKASKSLREASRASGLIPDVGSILTRYDPKDYSSDEIKKILTESLIRPMWGRPVNSP